MGRCDLKVKNRSRFFGTIDVECKSDIYSHFLRCGKIKQNLTWTGKSKSASSIDTRILTRLLDIFAKSLQSFLEWLEFHEFLLRHNHNNTWTNAQGVGSKMRAPQSSQRYDANMKESVIQSNISFYTNKATLA